MAKSVGPTSHDIVAAARRALGTTRVGHLGTLDPFAAGLLVLVIGRATRLAPFAARWDKAYVGVIRLGQTTATDDLTGAVTASSEAWRTLDRAQIDAALTGFRGGYDQRPPAYSAVKLDGERAYRRARRGETVAPAARRVEVFQLEIEDVALPEIRFRATVGGGTYLRGIARDLGHALGCGAHLAALTRTAVGPFRLEDAVAAETLTPGALGDAAVLVAGLPRYELDEVERTAVRHGRAVAVKGREDQSEPGTPGAGGGAEMVALFADGELVAVGERVGAVLKPRVVVAEHE